MTVQVRFARPSWTSGFLVLQGLDALDHRLLPSLSAIAQVAAHFRARALSPSLRS